MLFHFYFYFGGSSKSSKQLRSANWQGPGWESHRMSGDTWYCWRVYFPLMFATQSQGSDAAASLYSWEAPGAKLSQTEGVSHWNAQHLHLLLSSVELESVLLLEKKIREPRHISRKWHLNYVNISAFFFLKNYLIWILHQHCDLKKPHSFIIGFMRPGIPFVFWHEQKHNKACNRMGMKSMQREKVSQ